jgi:hypothetical protein
MRVVLRLQAAADELASGSVLQDMFDAAVGSGEDLSVAALETVSSRLFQWQCVASTSHAASKCAAIKQCHRLPLQALPWVATIYMESSTHALHLPVGMLQYCA